MFKKQDIQSSLNTARQIIEQNLSGDNINIKKYIKGRLLGKGGFAKCYQLTSQETKLSYAAKIIEKNSLLKAKARQKLQLQIKIHKGLKHSCIVGFEHFFEDYNHVYILLEICPHQTLNQLLKRRKKLTELEVKYYIKQIAQALKYLHSNKVIHRDLKLGNLFLSETLQIKLGDFGLATTVRYTTQRKNTMCGTPNYIAPEILENKKGYSYQVDIWSLGVITFALLFGKPPFQTNQVKLTYSKIKSCTYTFPDIGGVSEQAKQFVSKMLQLDPTNRPTVEQILEDQFLKIGIPMTLPISTLACPPNANFINQFENKQKSLKNYDKNIDQKHSNKLYSGNKKCLKSTQKMQQINSKVSMQKVLHTYRTSSSTGFLSINKNQIIRTNKLKILKNMQRWIIHYQQNIKFGICYILNTNSIGMKYNDNTCLISNIQFNKFKYLLLQSSMRQTNIDIFQLINTPKYLHKKMKIITHYSKILRNRINEEQINKNNNNNNNSKIRNKIEQLKQNNQNNNNNNNNINFYLNRYLRTSKAIFFWFNNKDLQVIFDDSSELLIHQGIITFVNKFLEKLNFKTQHCNKQSQEIQKRLYYISGVTKKMKNYHKQNIKENKQNISIIKSQSTTKLLDIVKKNNKNYQSTNKIIN